jgi:hypothetical protein
MIGPKETEIEGNWIEDGGRVIGDPACLRVERLTKNYLIKLGYREESGGPASLKNISESEAWAKYPNCFVDEAQK